MRPKLSSKGRILAVLLVVFVFCDILLSPIGFETRGSAILSSASSIPWFILLIAGLVLNIVALIALFFRPRLTSILAIIGSIVYIIVLVADQVGLVISISPPPLITDVEIVTLVVLLATLIYSARIFNETRVRASPSKTHQIDS